MSIKKATSYLRRMLSSRSRLTVVALLVMSALIGTYFGVRAWHQHTVTGSSSIKSAKQALEQVRNASSLSSDLGFSIKSHVNDIVYVKRDNAAYLSSRSLIVATNGACNADQGPLGIYTKIYKSGLINDADSLTPWWETASGLTAAATKPDSNGVIIAKEFKDFYIVYLSPQNACGNSQISDMQQSAEAKAAAQSVSSAQESD